MIRPYVPFAIVSFRGIMGLTRRRRHDEQDRLTSKKLVRAAQWIFAEGLNHIQSLAVAFHAHQTIDATED